MSCQQDLMADSNAEYMLASAWARICAFVINQIMLLISLLPFLLSMTLAFKTVPQGVDRYYLTSAADSAATVGYITLAALLLWQCVFMSLHGQSIGKRIVGIRVLFADGRNSGFLGTVLLRELLFKALSTVTVFTFL